MDIEREGYTFFPRDSLYFAVDNFFKDIFLNQSIFLKRYMVFKQTIQPYIFIKQLDLYRNQPFIITISKGILSYNFTTRYFRISFVNESNDGQINKTSGF